MKLIILYASILLFAGNCYSQCRAEAGVDKHLCHDGTTNTQISVGGNPTAALGTPPFTYEWRIDPIPFVVGTTSPAYHAHHLLNDTTVANPTLLYDCPGDSVMFYVTVTDANNCVSTDSCLVTYSCFGSFLVGYTYTINQGDSVYLNESTLIGSNYNPMSYEWSPTHGLSQTNIEKGFWAKPDSSIFYDITVTDTKGCQYKEEAFYSIIIEPLGVKENNQNIINTYPNPVEDILFLDLDSQTPLLKIEVYSVTGELMLTEDNPINSINFENISPGNYFLKMYFKNSTSTQKLIKK